MFKFPYVKKQIQIFTCIWIGLMKGKGTINVESQRFTRFFIFVEFITDIDVYILH